MDHKMMHPASSMACDSYGNKQNMSLQVESLSLKYQSTTVSRNNSKISRKKKTEQTDHKLLLPVTFQMEQPGRGCKLNHQCIKQKPA